ncbi:ABC transporter substrate-binding protein [Humidesulfovibrio idahonensis]
MLKFIYLAYGVFSLLCLVLGLNAIHAWMRGRPLTRWPYWWLAGFVAIALGYYFWGASSEYSGAARHRQETLMAQEGPIVIAAVWPARDDGFFHGAELAVRHVNQGGGVQVMGPDAQLIWRKLELKPVLERQEEVDRSAYSSVVFDTKVLFAVGHAYAPQAISASIAYDDAGVLYLASSVSDPFLTIHGFSRVLRTISNDRDSMFALAAACQHLGLKRIIVLKARSMYWETVGRQFADALSTLAVPAPSPAAEMEFPRVMAVRSYPTNDPDFIALLSDIATMDFDAVMLADEFPRAAGFIRAMRERGMNQPILGPHGLEDTALFKLADGWATDIYIVTNHAGQAAVRESTIMAKPFYDDYTKTYGQRPDAASTEAYETIRLLAQGIAAARTVNPAVVASKLRSQDDWQGLYGTIGFDHRGDATNRKLFLKRSAQGTFVLADPEDMIK